jgi:probable rRNA maturation factor
MGESALRVDSVGLPPAAGRALVVWLARVAPARARGAVTVAVTTDARVRALNGRFRRVHTTTDVLSFPAGERGVLGDIVIAGGVARRQAKAAGHPVATELKVLALHGLLHLMGYDHETDDGRMARAEARLRRKGGLESGLIERSRPRPRTWSATGPRPRTTSPRGRP